MYPYFHYKIKLKSFFIFKLQVHQSLILNCIIKNIIISKPNKHEHLHESQFQQNKQIPLTVLYYLSTFNLAPYTAQDFRPLRSDSRLLKYAFFFFMNMTFIHNASFFLLGFLVHFIFRTTFLNKKLYTVPKFQQTLLTTMKQVPT